MREAWKGLWREERLLNQQILEPRFTRPADLVRWMGAVQAQDYAGGLWALGLRLPEALESAIEEALAARTIVRTWPMRGTLHLVPAADVRWMLGLLTPRVIARSAGRYRELGLDDAAFKRSRDILTRALRGGKRLMRHDAYAVIERGGVSTAGQRGIHIVGHLAQQGFLCFGPRQGRQPTFVLLEEWLPASRKVSRDEALATLATRYFASHGPATLHDFAWWSGLLLEDAQEAIEAAGSALGAHPRDRRVWHSAAAAAGASRRAGKSRGPAAALLPPWDEYIVAYKDRAAALGHLREPYNGTLAAVGTPLIVIDGRVRGSWRRTLTAAKVCVTLDFWTPVTNAERRAVERAVARYGRFLGREASHSFRTESAARGSRREP